MEWTSILALFGSFILMLVLSVPISFAIAISTLITIMISLPLDSALTVVTQKMASGLDNFCVVSNSFFYFSRQYHESWWHCHPFNCISKSIRC